MALSTKYIKGLIEACIEASWNIGAYLVSRHQLGNLPYNSSKIHDYNMSTIEHQPPPKKKNKKKTPSKTRWLFHSCLFYLYSYLF